MATIVAVVLGISATSVAETEEDLARGRALFQEALSLEVAGDYASALVKLQQVSRVRLTPQVRYHLARCKENLGRLTEALGDYRVASTEARAADLPEVDEFERARLAMEARVPRLKVTLRNVRASDTIELDGVALGVVALVEPVIVDPGTRHLVLRSGDVVLERRTVTALEGQTVEVTFELATVPVSKAGAGPAVAEQERRRGGAPAWAYAAGAAGVLGTASAIGFWVVRNRALADLDESCDNGVCPYQMESTVKRGEFASWAAPVAGAVGAAGLSLAVWGFWPRDNQATGAEARRAPRITVNAGTKFAGVRFSSEF